MVVADRDVRGRLAGSGFERDWSSPVDKKQRVIVTSVELPGSMPSVLRAFRRPDLYSPGRKSNPAAVTHVKVRGVQQCNAIQGEVITTFERHQTRRVLAAARARLVR